MDPNQQPLYQNPVGQPTNWGNSHLSDLFNNKKFLIAGGVVLLLIVGLSIIFTGTNTGKKTNTSTKTETNGNSNNTNTPEGTLPGTNTKTTGSQTASPTLMQQTTAEVAARNLYLWYVTHPDPLASGAYMQRADITDEYKAVMGGYVRRGLSKDRDDIFNCGDKVLPEKVTAHKIEEDLYTGQALIRLKEAPGGRDLFLLKMQWNGNFWLLRDVWC